jgi:hypothetical protein
LGKQKNKRALACNSFYVCHDYDQFCVSYFAKLFFHD